MFPLKLEIKEIQYDISAKCKEIKLCTSDNKEIFIIDNYDNYVDIDLLKEMIERINSAID